MTIPRVVKGVTGEILVKQKPLFKGDNAFIVWGATTVGGTVTGENAIIEVYTVASGYIEDNTVGGVYLRIASVRQSGTA